MSTYVNNSSALWFYSKSSDVLYINEDTHKVGINNPAPQYELQVDGAVYATTYCNLPAFALSNDIYPITSYASNQIPILNNNINFCSNTAIYSSNNLVRNGLTVSVSNLQVLSNINTNSLSYKGSNVLDTDGLIDYKYLKNAPDFNSNGQLATTGVILGALGLATAAGVAVLTQAGKTGPALQDDIANRLGNDALNDDYDPDAAEDTNFKIHWNNIVYPPIYQNLGKQEIGIGSNLYIARGSAIYSIDKNNLVAYDNGRSKRIANNPTGTQVIFDTETSTLVSKYILCSSNVSVGNIVATKFLQSSNLTASNAIMAITSTSNINVSSQVQCGNFYINPSGIYVGDPSNPFTSTQIIDAVGNYKGTLNKEQIINLEAMNLNSLADGIMEWSGFQSAINPTFTDPFGNSMGINPLFDI